MNKLFKDKKIKITKQRSEIFGLINQLKDNATLKNIVSECSSDMDTSTVYRIIDLFIEKGLIEKRVNYNDEIYYNLKEEHGHYFTCIKCNKREKIENCPLEDIEDKYEKEGYTVLSHTVLMTGICNKCKNRK